MNLLDFDVPIIFAVLLIVILIISDKKFEDKKVKSLLSPFNVAYGE